MIILSSLLFTAIFQTGAYFGFRWFMRRFDPKVNINPWVWAAGGLFGWLLVSLPRLL